MVVRWIDHDALVKKAVVVGGGITGAYVAYHLSRSGWKTVVVDPDDPRCRASDNNPGGINPLHGPGIPGVMSAFAMDCYRTHIDEWPRIRDLSGDRFHETISSRIFVAFSSLETENLERSKSLYDNTDGFSSQWLTETDFEKHEPGINPKAKAVLRVSGNGKVDSVQYTRAVLKAAVALGVDRVKGRVEGIRQQNHHVRAVLLGKEEIACDQAVFCTGPWMNEIDLTPGISIPVRPVRGEMLLIRLPGNTHPEDITWNLVGLYHHKDDLFWLGGTFEYADISDATTTVGREKILKGVEKMVPRLRILEILRQTIGFRSVTPDKLPVLGRIPGLDNAYIANGGGSKGLLLSSGLGKALIKILNGEELPEEYMFMSAGRFNQAKE